MKNDDRWSKEFVKHRFVQGILILGKYSEFDIAASHDKVYAGPYDPDDLSSEDKEKMLELGWRVEYDSWAYHC
jgi:hypothetical protein